MGGLFLTSIYGFAYKLWPIAIPLIADVACMITLIILKVYFDKFGPTLITQKDNETQHASDSEIKVKKGLEDLREV